MYKACIVQIPKEEQPGKKCHMCRDQATAYILIDNKTKLGPLCLTCAAGWMRHFNHRNTVAKSKRCSSH